MEAVPSHTELDVAMENINETLHILNTGEFPPSDRPYGYVEGTGCLMLLFVNRNNILLSRKLL